MLTTAAYIRVSKEEQAEKDLSLPAQKSRIIAYCQSQDWEIHDFYVDDGYSAKDLERPDMKRLIKDAKAGKFNAVVVVRLDRISRKQKDVLYLIEDVFEPSNVGFKSVTQPFDTTTAFGKAAIGMLAVFAQLERDQLIERVIDAKKEAALQGRFMGGPPPYGYRHNPATKTLEIDDIQSNIVRIIYDEYLKGDIGYQAIADMLNERKIPAPMAASWNRSTVIKFITNPTYAGFLPHKGQLYPGRHPAIIPPDQWDQAQQLLSSRQKYQYDAHSGLISGMVYCGECGARMRTKNVWQNYPCKDPKRVTRYYICYSQDASTPYMIRDDKCKCGYKQSNTIDQMVVSKLMEYSVNTKLIKEAARDLLENKNSAGGAKALTQTKKEYDALKKKIDRWYNAFERGVLDPDELMSRVKELRERKYYLEQEIMTYQEQLETEQERVKSVDQLLSVLKNFKRQWVESTPDECKSMVQSMVKSVRIYKDSRIELDFFI